MTGNDSRPSLWERFVNWETGDESVLDGEIEQSMDQAAPQEAGGEVYASAEKRADDHRTALVEEERSYYSRVHEWSLHKGVKFINRLYRLSAVLVLCFIIFFLMSTVVALPPFGEADIVAADGDTIVFCEVKTRLSEKFGTPAEAVEAHKQRRYIDIARYFLMKLGRDDVNVRFDVVEVFADSINHIENAFGA